MNIYLQITLLILVVIAPGLLTYFLKKLHPNSIKLLLSFSGGFLLSIAFIHFIPELYIKNSEKVGLFILLGFLFQVILEFLSKGIEHGHTHVKANTSAFLVMMIGLSIHALIEGIPLAGDYHGHEHAHDHSGSFTIFTGIMIHKLPVAISLTTLMLGSNLKLKGILVNLFIFSLMAPIGLIIGKTLHTESLFEGQILDFVFAMVIGMFLHISTTIIFESSEGHKFNLYKFLSILLGFGIAILLH
ncbi:MAG: ZIP family metal transporter [Crocinitomicaceae bacterium]